MWRTVLNEASVVTDLSDMPAALCTIAEQPLGHLAAMAASLTAMAIEFRSSERVKMLIRAATTPQELIGAATNMWTVAKGAERVTIATELHQFVVVLRSGGPADLASARLTALKKLSIIIDRAATRGFCGPLHVGYWPQMSQFPLVLLKHFWL